MDIEKYLASLEDDEQLNIFSKEEDGLEPGLLSELEMQVPEELHGLIMKATKNETAATIPEETTKFTRKINKYKIYMPLVAAAALFIVFVGNVNFNKVNDQLAFKSAVQEQKVQGDLDKKTEDLEEKTNVPAKINKATDIKNNKILTASISTSKISSKEITKEVKIDNLKRHNETLDLKVNHIEDLPVVTKISNVKSDTDDNNIIVSVNDTLNKNTLQKEPASSPVDKTKDKINTDSKNIVVASNYGDDYVSTKNNSDFLRYFVQPNLNDNYNDNALLAMNSTNNEDADYELNLYMNQTEVINYIYNNGNMIGANIYKFSTQDFYSLKQILASKNIDINGLSDSKANGDYVTVNVIIN